MAHVDPHRGADSEELQRLFAQIERSFESDPTKALHACDRVLSMQHGDSLALKCKGVLLVNAKKYDVAVTTFEQLPTSERNFFQHAYALYRVARFAEAKQMLLRLNDPVDGGRSGVLSLLAQVHYNLEEYAEAAAAYNKILDEELYQDDEEHLDLLTNLSAVYCCMGDAQACSEVVQRASTVTHDLLYNAASALVENKRYEEALKMLNNSSQLCFREHELSTEEVDRFVQSHISKSEADAKADVKNPQTERLIECLEDLAVVRVQEAYVRFQRGELDAAEAILAQVLALKPTSVSTLAVASVNWAAIKKTSDLFDTLRKLKHAGSPQVLAKLTSKQRLQVKYNTALLLLHMNQLPQCRALVDSMCEENPESDLGPLVMTALLLRDKKVQKAEEMLRGFIASRPGGGGTLAQLTVAQMWLSQGQVDTALEILRSITAIQNEPAVIATVSAALASRGQTSEAIALLESAKAQLGTKKDSASQKLLGNLLVFSAELFSEIKHYRGAAESLEQLLKLRGGNDVETLCRYTGVLAYTEPRKADEMASRVLSLTGLSSSSQIPSNPELNGLELPPKALLDTRGYVRVVDVAPQAADGSVVKVSQRSRPMRRPPKNIVQGANIDPERWIPIKERTYIKDLPPKRRRELKMRRAEEDAQRRRAKMLKEKEAAAAAAAAAAAPTEAPQPEAST